MIEKLNPGHSVAYIRSNQDVRDLLPDLDELVQRQCVAERDGDADVPMQVIPEVRVLRWDSFVPQPWMPIVK